MTGDLMLVRRLAAADQGLAVISTTRSDGTVHSSLVNAGVFDHPRSDFPPDGIPALLREIFTSAGGTHDDWAEFDRVMAEELRSAVAAVLARR